MVMVVVKGGQRVAVLMMGACLFVYVSEERLVHGVVFHVFLPEDQQSFALVAGRVGGARLEEGNVIVIRVRQWW